MIYHSLESICKLFGLKNSNVTFLDGFKTLFEAISSLWKIKRIVIPYPTTLRLYNFIKDLSCDIGFMELREEESFRLCVGEVGYLIEEKDLIFIQNPLPPSGFYLDRDRLKALIRLVDSREAYILIDETFVDLVEDVFYEEEFLELKSVMVLRFNPMVEKISNSPCLLIGNSELINALSTKFNFKVGNDIEQKLRFLIDAINDVRNKRTCLINERKRVALELFNLGFKVFESKSNYILVKYHEVLNALNDKLESRGFKVDRLYCSNFDNFLILYISDMTYNSELIKNIGSWVDEGL